MSETRNEEIKKMVEEWFTYFREPIACNIPDFAEIIPVGQLRFVEGALWADRCL